MGQRLAEIGLEMINRYVKYCPNVFIAACEEEHAKGDEITLTTKYGKENLHIVHNFLGKNGKGEFCYSITRSDGFTCQERARRKAERLEGFAGNARKRSDEYYAKSNKHRDFLVLGEPIKVGHHSERRHRKLLDDNWNNLGKSVKESEKAEEYKSRAQYWEGKAEDINLSMPESIEFYAHKLEQATFEHKQLKDNPKLRSHGMSLQYANRAKKEAEKNYRIALKLWGEPEEEPELEPKKEERKNPLDDFEGLFFAFNNEQFTKGMAKVGLSQDDTSKIVSIGSGGYLLKDRVEAFKQALA